MPPAPRSSSRQVVAPPAVDAYRKAVAELPRFQVQAASDLDYGVCYPCASFDRQSIHWDFNYFKYYFLRLAGISFSESALEADFSDEGQRYRHRKVLLAVMQPWFAARTPAEAAGGCVTSESRVEQRPCRAARRRSDRCRAPSGYRRSSRNGRRRASTDAPRVAHASELAPQPRA
jgi:hypothetical protein